MKDLSQARRWRCRFRSFPLGGLHTPRVLSGTHYLPSSLSVYNHRLRTHLGLPPPSIDFKGFGCNQATIQTLEDFILINIPGRDGSGRYPSNLGPLTCLKPTQEPSSSSAAAPVEGFPPSRRAEVAGKLHILPPAADIVKAPFSVTSQSSYGLVSGSVAHLLLGSVRWTAQTEPQSHLFLDKRMFYISSLSSRWISPPETIC